MDSGYQLIDILLFAGIAAFLVFRLRSVLGRRTGLERPPTNPFVRPPAAAPQPSAATLLPRPVNGSAAPPASGAAAITAADPSFTEETFLKGARAAFEIVVNGFAAGDKAALQPLLSKDVFERFSEAIDARVAAHETLKFQLVEMKSVALFESSLEGATALVTVKFVSGQINVTHGPDGAIRDGDPARTDEHIDFWTFARPVRSRDPNWILVATHSP
jgi:predicted lipid-binding transport protein (Tim44 family)